MHESIRSWLKEPFIHFTALGALLFSLHTLVAQPGAAPADQTIRITPGDIRRIAAAWESQWRRSPTREELINLLREHVQEEVFYREAVALGLDQDDAIIRRRLAQKMEFLLEDASVEQQPTEAQLHALFQENPARFQRPARTAFEHLYFSVDKRGPRARPDASQALSRLERGETVHGDSSMLARSYAAHTSVEVANLFGQAFADAVFALPPGSWAGPVESAYGWHLLRVESRTDGANPTFSEVRAEVRAAWIEQARSGANQRAYRRLREAYSVEMEGELSGIAAKALK